ncbi:MAG: glycosyltransferase [Acidobacteria bacterium]|nr:glycosyltransferase [Acidobacteriota bacterium]
MSDVYTAEFDAASTVIPYCAPNIEWQPSTAVLDRLGMDPNDYLVIAGRHSPENNIHRVAETVSQSSLELTLVVAGTANYDSPVTTRLAEIADADERIVLLGHVESRQDFFDLLHHATAYVHGHSVGGINPSLIEAMSVGARTIALDTPFNREALAEHGHFFSIDKHDLLDRIVETQTESPAARQAALCAVRNRIREVYSIDAVVDAYESVLTTAASMGRSTGLVVPTEW